MGEILVVDLDISDLSNCFYFISVITTFDTASSVSRQRVIPTLSMPTSLNWDIASQIEILTQYIPQNNLFVQLRPSF